MTEMMDLSSDVGGPGIPFLDYRTYAERIFFPGQRGAPLSQNLDLPESRRQTVEQGLGQLNNLLSNRLFLTRVSETPHVLGHSTLKWFLYPVEGAVALIQWCSCVNII